MSKYTTPSIGDDSDSDAINPFDINLQIQDKQVFNDLSLSVFVSYLERNGWSKEPCRVKGLTMCTYTKQDDQTRRLWLPVKRYGDHAITVRTAFRQLAKAEGKNELRLLSDILAKPQPIMPELLAADGWECRYGGRMQVYVKYLGEFSAVYISFWPDKPQVGVSVNRKIVLKLPHIQTMPELKLLYSLLSGQPSPPLRANTPPIQGVAIEWVRLPNHPPENSSKRLVALWEAFTGQRYIGIACYSELGFIPIGDDEPPEPEHARLIAWQYEDLVLSGG